MTPFISVCCPTFNRPEMLGELIHSFLIQDYPKDRCELIVLDDAGQYGNLPQIDRHIKFISVPHRTVSLGYKRNACMAFVSSVCDIIVPADDDDIYMPHWLKTIADNSEKTMWLGAEKTLMYKEFGGDAIEAFIHQRENHFNPFHAACAFNKNAMWLSGGYPHFNSGEDLALFSKFQNLFGDCKRIVFDAKEIYFIYRVVSPYKRYDARDWKQTDYYHQKPLPPASLEIGWRKDYIKILQDYTQ